MSNRNASPIAGAAAAVGGAPVFSMVSSLPAPGLLISGASWLTTAKRLRIDSFWGSVDRFDADKRGSAFVLQRHAGDPARDALARQPRDLEGGLFVAQPRAVDVGHAIALLIGEADARCKGEIGAEAVGRRQAGPLADQHHHHP